MTKVGAVTAGWETMAKGMRVVRLTLALGVLIPAIGLPSLPRRTRGLTLYPGRAGMAMGAVLMGASALVGYMLYRELGMAGPLLSAWLVGTAGGAMFAAALRPTAFVKSICASCRLLPVILEHEAIHLTGVASEGTVWESMRARHSVESLRLEGDPAICSFCPIPKRLAER